MTGFLTGSGSFDNMYPGNKLDLLIDLKMNKWMFNSRILIEPIGKAGK